VVHPSRHHVWFLGAAALLTILVTPLGAEAQRRGRASVRVPVPVVRTSIVVIGGIGYPRYGFYDPFYDPWVGWYQYPRRYPPYGPYGDPRYDFTSAVRIEVTPKEAQVFVDGYAAGDVDDFDGIFQRLNVRPGGHEIAIYHEGYRTKRHAIYLRPGATEHIRGAMEPLGAGETSELPVPAKKTEMPDAYRPDERGDQRPPSTRDREAPGRFGTLLLRVRPADAEILVDGERWETTSGQEQIAIRLPEGRHRVEIRREGFARYVEDVLIRVNRGLTLNVGLKGAEN
jgi:hypothetical protein